MLNPRSGTVLFLSLLCVATFLYYVIIPQGPGLLLHKGKGDAVQHSAQQKDGGEIDSDAMGPAIVFNAADKFTPEILLSAPRRGPAIPNPSGGKVAYTLSAYSFELHQKSTEIHVLDIVSKEDLVVASGSGINSPTWLSEEELLWIRPESPKNRTRIYVGDKSGNSYVAATIPSIVSDIKVRRTSDDTVEVALVALANRNGSLHNPAEIKQPLSSGKLYDSVMVRHWDTYVTPQRNAIWHGTLTRGHGKASQQSYQYALGDLHNILQDTGLESPIPTFGGLDNFDIGLKGICFVAKDPKLSSAANTKSNFYFSAIDYASQPPKYTAPKKFEIEQFQGASTSPVFSTDGESAAWLQMGQNGYESDKNHVFLIDVEHVDEPEDIVEMFATYNGDGLWDRSPSSVVFARDSKFLLLTAEEEGKTKLYKLVIQENPRHSVVLPEAITTNGHVSDVKIVDDDADLVIVSGTSIVDSSHFMKVQINAEAAESTTISSISDHGKKFGLSHAQFSDIWFAGADGHKVHALVMKPSSFDPAKKYPLAYLIHGGPQGAWDDSWSTRWNPAVFAEQGYVVVTPNPTGSTGYGQKFTDAIKENWGGRPYEDIAKGFEYIKANLSYVDTTRAVALGASYGGYMMNWIQGQDLGKQFKALVCHDGSFNLPGQLSSDEQYFPNHDLGSEIPTENPAAWNKWNPQAHISNWTTPMLVIHNELDYRLPISDGLAMFNVLQARGIQSRFLTFPDENHWVLNEENSLVWHTLVINWINSFAGLPEYMSEEALGIVVQN